MSAVSEIRDAAAAAVLEVAQQLGASGTFKATPADAGVTIYYLPQGERDDLGVVQAGPTDIRTLTIEVPRQTGFPPSGGIGIAATLVYGSETYNVMDADGMGQPVDLAPVIRLTLVRVPVMVGV